MNEKTTAEFEIEVSGGRITEAYVMPNGKCKMVIEVAAPQSTSTVVTPQEDIFVKVEASKLSIEDEFMKHQPQSNEERNFKELVKTAIKSGLKDFWHPRYDPSLDADGRICYVPGRMPAVNLSYNWWEENAKKYAPKSGSRLGTKTEYIAFMAVLIKELVASGKSIEWAWNVVCNDSKELGHYWNSKNAKHAFEDTGSREICGFFDLANTCKILAEDEENGGFWLAGGFYYNFGNDYPLAYLYRFNYRYYDNYNSCGWLVLTEGSTDH